MREARQNCDIRWKIEVIPGQFVYDEYEDAMVPQEDYVPDGSVELTPFEAMMFAVAGCQTQPYISNYDIGEF